MPRNQHEMQTTPASDNFKSVFLGHYLSVGIGALSKKDTDALVMHLLDTYAIDAAGPLACFPNQPVSALLRVPAAKIRQLRFEAGLKYGGRVEDQAKARLLLSLSRAVLDVDSKAVLLVIEDALAKSWLQGQLKNNGLIFDHSFNTEIVKVSASGLLQVLRQFFDENQIEAFLQSFEKIKKEKQGEQLATAFGEIVAAFAKGVATTAGGALLENFRRLGG